MTILLERFEVPERGLLEIDLKQSVEIRVTAAEARRKVSGWLTDEVTYMMQAEMPTLVIGAQVVWRVPAVFTSPQVGRVDIVGYVEVDVYTGQMNSSSELASQFMMCAQQVVAKLPPYQPGIKKAPDKFIPKDIPRASLAQLPPDDEEP
jgi:hypothetical protein